MGRHAVRLLYDVISPYSWLGFEILLRYRQAWALEVKLEPVLLGGIMHAASNTPPGAVPLKRHYMMRDLVRVGHWADVPIGIPADPEETMFKKGTLKAQRLLTAAALEGADLESLSRALWMRTWSKDLDVTADESLLEACGAAGLSEGEAQGLLSKTSDAIKDALKANTMAAVHQGVFGAPMVVTESGDMFFGWDRLELLGEHLGEKWHGPKPPAS